MTAACTASPDRSGKRDTEGHLESHSLGDGAHECGGPHAVLNPADLNNVKTIQAGSKVQPLSAFARTPPPPAASDVQWHKPLAPETLRTSPEFLPDGLPVAVHPAAAPKRSGAPSAFRRLGIEPGKPFNAGKLPPDVRAAVVAGMADGQQQIVTSWPRSEGRPTHCSRP